MLIDLFAYSKATQGAIFGIEALIEAARCAHLDAFCITDREVSSHAYEILRIAERFDFFVGIGLEIETSAGPLCVYPEHIDDEFVNESWRDYLGDYPDPQVTIDYFKERGAAIVARNIYVQGSGLKDRIFTLRDLDAIDVLSASRRRIDNELAIEAQQRIAKPGVGGSGVFDVLDEIGHVATLLRYDSYTQEQLVSSLCSKDLWAVSLRPIGEACPQGAQREESGHRERESTQARSPYNRRDSGGSRNSHRDSRRGKRNSSGRGERGHNSRPR